MLVRSSSSGVRLGVGRRKTCRHRWFEEGSTEVISKGDAGPSEGRRPPRPSAPPPSRERTTLPGSCFGPPRDCLASATLFDVPPGGLRSRRCRGRRVLRGSFRTFCRNVLVGLLLHLRFVLALDSIFLVMLSSASLGSDLKTMLKTGLGKRKECLWEKVAFCAKDKQLVMFRDVFVLFFVWLALWEPNSTPRSLCSVPERGPAGFQGLSLRVETGVRHFGKGVKDLRNSHLRIEESVCEEIIGGFQDRLEGDVRVLAIGGNALPSAL